MQAQQSMTHRSELTRAMHRRALTTKDRRLIREAATFFSVADPMQDDTDTEEIIEYANEPTAQDEDF